MRLPSEKGRGTRPFGEAHPAPKAQSFLAATRLRARPPTLTYFSTESFSKLPLTMGLASRPNQSSTIVV
jgi:hypothetical protein